MNHIRSKSPIRNPGRRRLWTGSLLALLMTLAAVPGLAAVRASLDRDTVYSNDIFTLTIESEKLTPGQQPDLAPLDKDFEVLGTSTSAQVSIFNGQRTDKTLWQVELQARHTGQLIIPPLDIDGQRTEPVELKVTEAPQQPAAQINQHVFIETEIGTTGKAVYVQQQIPYTIRLYYDNRLQEGELSTPEPENTIVEQLGDEKRYNTVRDNHSYNVIERNYVISPEKSGALSIPPAIFRGHISVPQQQHIRRPRNPMEAFLNNSPFANDPFFRNSLGGGLLNDPFASPGKSVTVRSRAIDMTIKPRPAIASIPWLPAESVTLHDSWTEIPPQFKVGEVVSRTITIQARGLSGIQIPDLSIAALTGVRVYPEASTQENHSDGKAIDGVRTQTLTYIPGVQGTLDIPPVTLKWWDIRHDRPAITTLPAWKFTVLPGTAGTASKTRAIPGQSVIQADNGNNQSPQEGPGLATMIYEATHHHRRWLLAGGGALIILILLLTIRVRYTGQQKTNTPVADRTGSPATRSRNLSGRKSALRALEKACAINDRQATVQALLNLGHSYWPDNPPHSLGALAKRIEKGRGFIQELDRSLYAAETTDWQGSALWNEFRHGLQEKKVVDHHRDTGLKPLYPQHS